MIRGRMSEDGESAIVPVAIADSSGRLWPVEAIIDTGFVGDIALPPNIIRRLELIRMDSMNFVLAHGESARLNRYQGSLLWHDRLRNIAVTEAYDVPLIGIRLLSGSRVTMDVSPGGEVLREEIR